MTQERPPAVAASYARCLLDYLREQGIDPARLYPAAQIATVSAADLYKSMPLSEWAAMFSRAVEATGDIDLPLKVGMSVRTTHLGMLGFVLMNCINLGEVAQQLARYHRLIGDTSGAQIVRREHSAELCWVWPHAEQPYPVFQQCQLATRMNFARWLSGRPLRADAWFSFPRPADTGLYELIFGGELHFDQPEIKLVFPMETFEVPVTTANPALRPIAEGQASEVLARISGEAPFIRQLRQVLAQDLAAGRASREIAAAHLNLSTRTLHRRIEAHGTSFRAVLDSVRCEQARSLLTESRCPLAEIAFMLGYTEQSTFQQAFKRWTGMTPGDYRSRHTLRRSA